MWLTANFATLKLTSERKKAKNMLLRRSRAPSAVSRVEKKSAEGEREIGTFVFWALLEFKS